MKLITLAQQSVFLLEFHAAKFLEHDFLQTGDNPVPETMRPCFGYAQELSNVGKATFFEIMHSNKLTLILRKHRKSLSYHPLVLALFHPGFKIHLRVNNVVVFEIKTFYRRLLVGLSQ